jgi:hypothetical protein
MVHPGYCQRETAVGCAGIEQMDGLVDARSGAEFGPGGASEQRFKKDVKRQ